jgi:hypothetical protein
LRKRIGQNAISFSLVFTEHRNDARWPSYIVDLIIRLFKKVAAACQPELRRFISEAAQRFGNK